MSKLPGAYDIDTTEILHDAGVHFDVNAIGAAHEPWWNRTLCAVNDAWVRLGVMQGDFHWHKHDDTDEFFLVMEGILNLELEGRTVTLRPGEAFTVPRGTLHFPHACGRVVALMVEQAGVTPTGS